MTTRRDVDRRELLLRRDRRDLLLTERREELDRRERRERRELLERRLDQDLRDLRDLLDSVSSSVISKLLFCFSRCCSSPMISVSCSKLGHNPASQ